MKEKEKSIIEVFWNWLRVKILDIITYAVYIRLFMESQEAFMLSATSEIRHNLFGSGKLEKIETISSFIFACFVLIIAFLLPVSAFYYYYKHRNGYDPKNKFFCMEYFTDMKNRKYARLYTPIVLARRFLFIAVIIFLNDTPRIFIYSFLISKPIL